MSREIERIEIGGVEDGRLVLGNAGFAANLSVGTEWTRIRGLVRLAFDDFGESVLGTPKLYFGMHSNPNANLLNGPAGDTSHFVGLVSNSTIWTRQAGPPVRYSLTQRAVVKIGTETTLSGTNNSMLQSGTPNEIRKWVAFEITKGSPNYTIETAGQHTTWTNDDVTLEDIKTAMGLSQFTGTLSMNNSLGGQAGSFSLAVDEDANGPLNSILIQWDRDSVKTRISDILWTHFE